ncbi:hypothetical protein KIW84_045129 [Lathyrus oleraceus]|uniref:C2 domain-containing protein n=1 Tax=Pisum sativum TaxID=3888 RepID=A0A9D4XJZ2_PEA|nr:hypothetical protein KIW84_045129 [Pisum sativum]
MGLTSRTLEITVISGENIHVTEDAYVVVRGESLDCYTTKTVKDNKSSFLSWDEMFLLDMPLHARSITFEVQCKRFKSVRPIGVARIAVADFLNGVESENFTVAEKETVVNGKSYSDRLTGMDFGGKNSNGVVVGIPFWWNYPNII